MSYDSPAAILHDSGGTEVGTSANPLRVEPAGSTPQLIEVVGGGGVSSFGDPVGVTLTPIFQFDFVGQLVSAGTMTQQGGAYIANAGTVATDGGRLRLTTGTNSAGAAAFMSYKVARYRAGQGMVARFTAVFQTGLANSTQIVGMSAPSITWTNNATAPGQPITAVTVGDGYFFGYNGTAFGIRHKNSRGNGGLGKDDWVAQASWNGDKCDGSGASGFTLDPTKGNVYMIKYPYLGYGNIHFYVQDSNTGRWILCHTIKYANSFVETQLGNASLNFFAQVINSGNTTTISMFVGSVAAFLYGERIYTGPQFGWEGRLANNTANTELPVFSLRCATRINGEPNRGMIRLRSASFSGDGANTDCRFTIRRNSTLTGSTFANAVHGTITGGSAGYILTSAQSMSTVDTAATAIAAAAAGAADTLFNSAAARNTGYQVDLTPLDIFIVPGDTLSFCMTSQVNNNAVRVAVNWQEDI